MKIFSILLAAILALPLAAQGEDKCDKKINDFFSKHALNSASTETAIALNGWKLANQVMREPLWATAQPAQEIERGTFRGNYAAKDISLSIFFDLRGALLGFRKKTKDENTNWCSKIWLD